MHLVLGSERIDLGRRVVVIAGPGAPHPQRRHADLVWTGSPQAEEPFGADADDVDGVRRLAGAGAVAVGLTPPRHATLDAAAEEGLTVLVPRSALDVAVGRIAPERLLVTSDAPTDGATAVLDLAGTGPAAWGRATVALAAGVRVVRTSEPRSIRRVATVVQRLTTAGVGA